MRPRYRVSRNAIELIKRFEGYRRKAARLPDGRWTIGYGHTLTAREGAEVSEEDAEALLIYDLIAVAHAVNENVFAPITQNQFDALVSFAFNLGTDAFRGSQVLARLNAGETLQAACAMELWRKTEFQGDRIVLDALVRRRSAEKTLFLTPSGDDWPTAPSPVLRPLVDRDAAELIPAETPTELVASLEGEVVRVGREGKPAVEPAPPTEEPGAAVRAAAEAVTARLQAIYPDGDAEPAPEAIGVRPQADFAPPVSAEIEVAEEAAPEPAPEWEPQPTAEAQAGAATEVAAAALPEREPEPAPRAELEFGTQLPAAPEGLEDTPFEAPEPANDARLAVEPEPDASPRVLIDDNAVHEFIPSRVAPLPRKAENGGLATDLILALLGLAFFGFGLFWGLNARGSAPIGGMASPLLVAWIAGVAGIGFFVFAVFRLLERLGRMSDRG